MKDKIYLSGLNGIRALAALAVVLSHINNRLDYFKLPKSKLLDIANFSVTIFFTLSGFLITYLLLQEKDKTGTIDIKKFYIRRILRIWPLYFAYLLIVCFFNGSSAVHWQLLFIVLMIPNFIYLTAPVTTTSIAVKNLSFMTNHYWSIGVEEQFYAFWPWIIKKSNNLLLLLIIFPVAFVLLKFILKIIQAPQSLLTFMHYTRFACIAIGALGAYLYFTKNEKFNYWFTKKWIEVFAWLTLVVVACNKFHIASIIDHEIISVIAVVIIINQISNSNKFINLENSTLDYLGKVSYGIYVYNPLIIYLVSYIVNALDIQNVLAKKVTIYITCVFGVIFIAHLSYTYFEKRFLMLKYKYMVIKSSSSKADL